MTDVPTTRAFRIESLEQVRALESSVCQEIVDIVESTGASSVAEMARYLGRRPDSLYYHVRKLADVGLLEHKGIRGTGRRAEAVYDVPARPLRLAYEPKDPDNVRATSRVIASMLRVAERDFRAGFQPQIAITAGPRRNLWAARSKGWLSETDLEEVNELLARLSAIFRRHRGPEETEESSRDRSTSEGEDLSLHSLTWILAPVEASRTRRGSRTAAGDRPSRRSR